MIKSLYIVMNQGRPKGTHIEERTRDPHPAASSDGAGPVGYEPTPALSATPHASTGGYPPASPVPPPWRPRRWRIAPLSWTAPPQAAPPPTPAARSRHRRAAPHWGHRRARSTARGSRAPAAGCYVRAGCRWRPGTALPSRGKWGGGPAHRRRRVGAHSSATIPHRGMEPSAPARQYTRNIRRAANSAQRVWRNRT